jgi:transcriptional regulator with XRE-family HTH domain
MYNTVGERISYCRNLLGISRREFVNAFGKITLPTLSRWELDYTAIPTLKLDSLINFFQLNGIDVSAEWILSNNGHPPINTNLQSLDKLNFDELAYITLSNLKNNIEHFEIYQINNNFFEPMLYNGDYVGGILNNNLEMLVNKLCYVIQDKMLYAGIFNFDRTAIFNYYKQSIKINDTSKIGVISWIAKR